ncbi:hypothetical protein REPUB_Repub19eG0128900 [Reevesia pubescens]
MILQFLSYATLFIASFVIVKAIISVKTRPKLPPGPIALPVIGHLHLLSPFIHQSFHKLSSIHGPLMYLRLGSVECVVASNPELAKELLKTYELTFSARKHTAAIDHLTYNSSFAFAPCGPYWKFIKKLSTFELLGETVNITQELLKLTNNIISQMMLSMRCSGTGNQADGVRTLVREVTEIFGEFNVSDIIWFCRNLDLQGVRKRFEDVHRRYDELLERIIRDREEVRKIKKKVDKGDGDNELKDFLDMMLDVLEDEHSEMQLTRNHIKALILDFLTAATDTTAIALEWALAELINHPEVLKKAQKEIDEVVGNNRLAEESDSPRLEYLQAIIKETFRLHPPIPMISRQSIEECKINGYTIPAQSLLFVNIWGIGRNPVVWENPFKFQPERFLKSNECDNNSGHIDVKGFHYQLLPFGTGRRGCPGISLAMQELPTTLAAMIQCFDWKVAKPNTGGVVDMTERPGLTAPRAQDLKCVPVARCTPTLVAT